MDDAVGVGIVSQKLIADFSGSLSDTGCPVENRFPGLVALDFMNDQHVRHVNSNDTVLVQVTEMLDATSLLHIGKSIHHLEGV